MDLSTFVSSILLSTYTLNEVKVLLELGYQDFSRDDLLSDTNTRVLTGTYSPAALTRTLQKLERKEPALISSFLDDQSKIKYRLVDRCTSYTSYEELILNIARSKLMTLNSMRAALQLISNKNEAVTARYLAQRLNLEADYVASSVLPRMFVIGLLNKSTYNEIKATKMPLKGINFLEEDIPNGKSEPEQNLLFFVLNEDWKGYVNELWM